MRAVVSVLMLASCGSSPEPIAIPTVPTPRGIVDPAPPPCAAWRFALTGEAYEVTESLTLADVRAKWTAGAIGASDETAAALAPLLGARGTAVATRLAIVPAHALRPTTMVIAVDGHHPLTDAAAPLVGTYCGVDATGPNLDPAKLTTLVMSGTTALTGRTAERIDSHGIADIVKFLAPFFTSADLVHVSNEVSFVRDCHPSRGQKELKFCARDSYLELLAALKVTFVELTGSHLLDHGTRSLARTLAMYERRGFTYFGGGRTQIDATEPRLVEHHGNKLALLGCNHVNWWIERISPGLGGAHCDYARLVWQVQDLRRRGYTPIVSIQHRELVTHTPDWDLVADLRKVAEAGAAFVQGSQAHTAHPWDVHHQGYVHYGPGNLLFAQHAEHQREAAVDKLYFYEGRLLSVGHLLVRTEHGQPRPLGPGERARFMTQMRDAEAAIKPPAPDVVPVVPPVTRMRPDSLVVRGKSQKISITSPTTDGGVTVVVRGAGPAVATAEDIEGFMRDKYKLAGAKLLVVAIDPATKPVVAKAPGKRRGRHRR